MNSFTILLGTLSTFALEVSPGLQNIITVIMLWKVISRCQRRNQLFTSLLTTAEVKDGGDLFKQKSLVSPAYRSKSRAQMLSGYWRIGSESLRKPTYIPCLQNLCLCDLVRCKHHQGWFLESYIYLPKHCPVWGCHWRKVLAHSKCWLMPDHCLAGSTWAPTVPNWLTMQLYRYSG